MKQLTCQPIQLPSLETCVKLRDLGVMPPLGHKVNAYNLLDGEWCNSRGNWSKDYIRVKTQGEYYTHSTANPKTKELVVFAPDLGQLVSIALQFFDAHFWSREIEIMIYNGNSIDIEKFALLVVSAIESCQDNE